MKRVLLAIGIICVLAAIIGITIHGQTSSQPQNQPDLVNEQTLAGLPTQVPGTIDTSHLGKGVVAPTNKWFSGIALEKTPQAVYPTPLSFLPTSNTFQIGLPAVTADATDIFGEAVDNITATIQGATRYEVTRYDQLSVDMTYYAGTKPLGVVTIAAGSPYVFFKAENPTTIDASSSGTVTLHGNQATIPTGTNTVTVAGFSGATLTQATGQLAASVPSQGLVSFYILPSGAPDVLATDAGNRITGTTVSYHQEGNNFQTDIGFTTANNRPTIIGALPHQQGAAKYPTALQYQTIYGAMPTIASNELSFTTPTVPLQDELDISKLNAQQKSLLVSTLNQDVNTTQFNALDTYYGGQQLYRAAQLLQLAHQLNQPQLASALQQGLSTTFADWFSDDNQSQRYFYYNPAIHGIVGVTSSFGTDVFNDHHFHYGYFIYAASILAKYDPAFLQHYESSVNLLVADIANYQSNEALPLRRNFDPYFGHSWASGDAPFADGNNQESSSEAINAWTATALWGETTHNSALQTEGEWMLSNEVAGSQAYWLDFNTSAQPYSDGFTKSVIGMNWGGKRDYATWFSADPSAMLAIQLVPLNPTMVALAGSPARIQQNVQEALPDGNYNTSLGDYILMYEALSGQQNTLSIAESMSNQNIDTADSRTYLYAWLMTNTR